MPRGMALRQFAHSHLLATSNEKRQVLAINFSQLLELNEIDAPFTQLAFRNKRMSFAESYRHFHLRHAGVFTRLNETSNKFAISPLIRLIFSIHA